MSLEKNKTKSSTLPRVSLFVLVYEHSQFIYQAVESALAQDYDNLQIIISDDCSTDDSLVKIKNMLSGYSGQHDVIVNSNTTNLGIGAHFRYLMNEYVEGDLIVAAAGDDISLTNRVSRIVSTWLRDGCPDLVAHDLIEINEDNVEITSDRSLQYKWQQNPCVQSPETRFRSYIDNPYPIPFIGAALAYTKSLYTRFGSPDFAPEYEDHLMYFRSLLGGSMSYIPEKLVRYRRHSSNFTNRKINNESNKLRKKLATVNFEFPKSELGQFRLHQLLAQQFLDYKLALEKGLVRLDIDYVLVILKKLRHRHSKFIATDKETTEIQSFSASDISNRKAALLYLPVINVVIYGAGGAGKKALSHLPLQFNVIAFVDSNSELHGTKILNIPVVAPTEINKLTPEVDSIIVASSYFFPILDSLVHQLHMSEIRVSRASEYLINDYHLNTDQDKLADVF